MVNFFAKTSIRVYNDKFFINQQDIHKDLEAKIAKFHDRQDAILYISCFDANAGLFEVLLTPDDAVLSDELNHASIIDGIRLCKAKKFRYKHKNMEGMLIWYWQCKILLERARSRSSSSLTDKWQSHGEV